MLETPKDQLDKEIARVIARLSEESRTFNQKR